MIVLIILGVVIVLILNYVTWFREWLKNRPWPWSQRYFEWIEPIEIALYRKSETILWSRFLIFMGLLPTVLDQFQLLNVPGLIEFLPDDWEKWASLSFTVCGIVSELLRRGSTKPLEIVELLETGMSPKVAVAVAKAETAKVNAVVAIEKAKTK